MIAILQIENGIWALEEDGRNVLLADCLRFGIKKQDRTSLMNILTAAVGLLREGKNFDVLIRKNQIKKLDREKEAVKENIWEVRSEGWGGRIVFVLKDPDTIIVSAVDKGKGSLSQAINRGIKRWKQFLKEQEKFPLLKHWV
ncbi:MAG: hypothetical protein Q7T11_00685 [Deltaproteobacteria bacterium]|nr:hypothetical protein [Deltaproteobacteria bacterium]